MSQQRPYDFQPVTMPLTRFRYRIQLAALLALLLSGGVSAQPLVTVEIDGVNDTLEDNIRLFLSIEQQRDNPLLSEGRIRRLHQKARGEIEAALQPYGYYRPRIDASLEADGDNAWLARYVVDHGPGIPVAVFDLQISGAMENDEAVDRLVDAHGLLIDSVFVHPQYDSFKSRLSGLASERGYVEGKFTRGRVEIDLDQYQARVYLAFDSGPRYRFGKVSLEQEVLDPELLQRYIPFREGDPYNLDQVVELQRALNDSDYFQVAEVSPGTADPATLEIPVSVRLLPRKNHRFDFGVGYGTDTGARALFGWRMPRVNEQGHRLDTRVELSEIGYDVGADYRIPVLNPRTDQMVYSISEEKEETDTNDSLLRVVGVSLNHNRGNWRETLSLNYQSETYEVADQSGTSDLLIPGVAWSRTWGGNFINVLDGLRFDVGLRGASEDLLSDTDFVQLRGGLKFIFSFDAHNRILARGSFGTTETPDFEQLPSSIRYFAGGSQSVRGYRYESLGPEDENGEVVGGRHLLTGSVEYEHYFDDRWGVALFIDAGNAIDSLGDDLEQGAGFGLRWKSIVGPVRIDLANAISTDDQDWRLHINIGPDL